MLARFRRDKTMPKHHNAQRSRPKQPLKNLRSLPRRRPEPKRKMDIQSQQPLGTGSASPHAALPVLEATQHHTVPSESQNHLENQPDRKKIGKNAWRQQRAKQIERGIMRENASWQFRAAFLDLLQTRYQDQKVPAHDVYQIYLQDTQNTRIESTRWYSLETFVCWTAQQGLCNECHRADEDLCNTESGSNGVYISSISNWRAVLEQRQMKPRVYREARMRKRRH